MENDQNSKSNDEELIEKYIELLEKIKNDFGLFQADLSKYLKSRGAHEASEGHIANLKKGGKPYQYTAMIGYLNDLIQEMESDELRHLRFHNERFGKILAKHEEEGKETEGLKDASDQLEKEGEEQILPTISDLTGSSQNPSKEKAKSKGRFLKVIIGALFFWLLGLSTLMFFQWSSIKKQPEQPLEKTILLTPHGGENSPWVDTGIEVNDGDEIKIEAFGKINLAFHRMVDAAKEDIPPLHAWTVSSVSLLRRLLNNKLRPYINR